MTRKTENQAAARDRTIRALEGPGPFLLVGHERPDGDSLGSILALRAWLNGRGAQAGAISIDGVPARFASLHGASAITHATPPSAVGVTVVVLDTPTLARTGIPEAFFSRAALIVNLDHHPDNRHFGHVNVVDISAPATALIVHELLETSRRTLTPEIAAALYVGIMTDTGGFRHANTDGRTLSAAARLALLGAVPSDLARTVYGERSLPEIHLLGTILAGAETALHGSVAVLTLTAAAQRTAGSAGEDLEGIASYGRLVQRVRVAVLLREEAASVRVSLRAADGVDVNAIAKRLGGGGHAAAAGATLPDTLPVVRERVLAAIAAVLE